ncbi:hypothetical protein C8J57DRAFT_1115330 [Mycena rebaudengoi]|nr:hypothetical protein C8J57DRAFT_1199520 [Mycena rebaudengoi]KAJ7289853.1 hypothetical protein C8J57DRAFT_1115330 [Mycena rebaudengoi]
MSPRITDFADDVPLEPARELDFAGLLGFLSFVHLFKRATLTRRDHNNLPKRHFSSSARESWLASLEPHSGATDEDKAKTLMSVAFAKPFDPSDKDMVNDMQALLDTVAGKTTSTAVDKRDSQFIVSASDVVLWHACAAFFSCVSGTTCSFNLQIGQAPHSQFQNQGGQNCCISWSTYKVQAGFFSTTWTTCNQEVNYDGDSSASCEGKSSTQGGDVCLSNRATGCT